MAANTLTLHPVQPRGWASGLGNLLGKELRAWWGTPFWLIQAALFIVAINLLPAVIVWVGPGVDPDMQVSGDSLLAIALPVLFGTCAHVAAVGVAVLGMGAIIREKQAGTAAWLLSKPLSRPAFILAKLVALGVGALALCVVLPGLAGYAQLAAAAGRLPAAGPFALGLALVGLHTLFYVTLTLMLGTFLNSRGAVISVALAALFGQPLLGRFVGPVARFLPDSLGDSLASLADPSIGLPLASCAAIGVTASLSVLFVLAALWRFSREEL